MSRTAPDPRVQATLYRVGSENCIRHRAAEALANPGRCMFGLVGGATQ
jgi:hypothetical protein